jgi:mannose-6-phosphate isomerase-like protein (cupin superfamily)
VAARIGEREREGFPDPARGDCTWFTLFSADITPTNAMSGGVAELAPGGPGLAPHRHAQPEIYYFVGGEGLLTVDGVETLLRAGEAAYIPGDAEHSLRNAGRETLRVFYVFPTDRFSDVVYRFSADAAA